MHRLVLSSLVSILLTGAFLPASVHAAVLTYDANTGTAGAQDGAGAGWNSSNTNFWDGAANVVWPNTTGDEAVFGAGSGAAGTVTVGTVTANAVTFNAPGSGNYTLSGGTITLGGTSPTIAANVNATINSILAGTAGLTKTGTGTLTLSGSGAAMDLGTNGVTVTAGTLRLARTSVPFDDGVFTAATPIKVETGATLEVAGTWNTGSANVITVNGGTLNFTNGVAADSSNYANNLNLANATVTGNGIRIGNASHAQFVVAGDVGTTIGNSLVLVNASGGSARTLALNVADGAAENDLVLSGILYDYTGRGGNQVAKTGAGTSLLTGNNTFTGTVAVNGGRLVMGHQNALGA
ncbi:MAG: autotransporter-associated beta strand repeat-containing protein, partial [Patescibacteria group bacterium]|nr:autotransporter-associated beta strand repeat-containing protein [Patescibacteria group bacterium]